MADPIVELIRRCQSHRDSGKKEKMSREDFVSFLRAVFPGETWVNHFVEGAEETVRTASAGGKAGVGFIDTLVRATALEYERDIRDPAIHVEGLRQLKMYSAALIARGTPVGLIRAVLSDFVKWEVYEVNYKKSDVASATAADIEFSDPFIFDTTTLAKGDEENYKGFLRAQLAREESRSLTADHLASDFGMNSSPFLDTRDSLKPMVEAAVKTDGAAQVATSLWSKFIDHLEGGGTQFRSDHYAAELYFCMLSRLLAANVLMGRALRSDDEELQAVVTGELFNTRFRLGNFVERDYFGWVLKKEHLPNVTPFVRRLQRDLAAYDFRSLSQGELFGVLIGQLSEGTQRRLLGQTNTPPWLGRQIAKRCLDALPKNVPPRFADMCCGSGSIMCEVLSELRARNGAAGLDELVEVITGFDIDALAVTFAKTTWVITLKDLVAKASHDIQIPIYHADSLFVAAPTARGLPHREGSAEIDVTLDGQVVKLPAVLIAPDYRRVFDDLVDWAYDNAVAADEKKSDSHITKVLAERRLDVALKASSVSLADDVRAKGVEGLFQLAKRMAAVAMAGRNGIWAFVLKNTYRPSLLAGQFNGIVSNPPWLALSRIQNNPYKSRITDRTDSYGLKPKGSSHLHLEIATTFLAYAVDRYLQKDGVIGVVLPGKIFDGDNHEPFRKRSYLTSKRLLPLQIDELWAVEHLTFRMPGAVIIGRKQDSASAVAAKEPAAFLAEESGLKNASLSAGELGSRSTWKVGAPSKVTKQKAASGHIEPAQGADLMPRRGIVVTVTNTAGAEYAVRTPRPSDPDAYAVSGAKKLETLSFDGFVAPAMLFRMLQSLSLVPFAIDERLPRIAVPVRRKADGTPEFLSDAQIQADGFRNTAKRFQAVDKAYQKHLGKGLAEYLNTRNKLTNQRLPSTGYLIVHGAGGSNVAAAMLTLTPKHQDVLIDQTVYWHVTSSAAEARYLVGVLNSPKLGALIDPFVTKGNFGKRHLHTLPWQVIPGFDASEKSHAAIAVLSESVEKSVTALIKADKDLANPAKWLKTGRRRVLQHLASSADMNRLNSLVGELI